MSRILRAALVASVVVGSATRIPAQSPNALVGKWSIEYERGRRMENGEATPIMGTGQVTFAPSGDSLIATLQAGPRPDGTTPPPTSFGGQVTPEGAQFVQEQVAQMNLNGEVREQKITLTWTFKASGDVLSGTLKRDLPMMGPTPPSPVKGTRLK